MGRADGAKGTTRAAGFVVVGVSAILALAGCGSTSGSSAGPDRRPTAATTPTSAVVSTTTTSPPSPAPAATNPAPPAAVAGLELLPAAARAPAATSDQIVVVRASGYGTSAATITVYGRDANGWAVAFGPWAARVGTAGLAPSGAKREGDGRTPSGTYGFGFAFGIQPDPGVRSEFRAITGPDIVWDDDSNSPNYNLWVDRRVTDAGVNPEPMANAPAYNLGVVIAYNTARTPGLGSAIFLHVSTGGATAGCVAIPQDQLVALLRWLDPARSPRIVVGVSAVLDA